MLQQAGTVPAMPEGLSAEDAAVFERVWRRVMAGREPLPPSEPESAKESLVPVVAERPEGLLPEQTEQMLEHMRMLAAGWRETRSLAGRATGSAARLLSGMAAEERRQLSRMAAVWYIMTGRRWHPESGPAPAPVHDLMEGLRSRWLHRNRAAAILDEGAKKCADPELGALYADLARGERAHGAQLLGILERMM